MLDLMTTKEFSEYMKVPVTTIHQWTFRKEFPYYKIGRKNFYKESEILKWIESKRIGGKL